MANKDDYLTCYREFFENFAQTVNPNDQLPVKLGSYKLVNVEVVGGIIDWTAQYLTQKKCPTNLIAPLIKIVIEEIRKACKKQPTHCGFNPADNAYEPLKLMQTVMAKTNEICLRYLDNSMLCSLPVPGTPFNLTSSHAVRNSRKRMEDRHVVIHDLNTMFNIQEASPSSYYAVFDGHAGQDAAAYSAAHLHQFLAENKYFVSDPKQALMDAFCKTDALFIEKCKVENLSSGTTAVVALLRPKENTLYVAWAGDSQALLVNQGRVLQVVDPHKPSRQDEKERIEKDGGCVMLWGTWRVNGQLAVSRAIGDAEYKPYVIAVPEIREISLDGGEDFLIIACDGLWDFLSEDSAAAAVYKLIAENPDDIERISQHLVQLSKKQGSNDNISVIVVFLREPSKIAAEACWADRADNEMEASLENANNPFGIQNCATNDNNILSQKSSDGLLLNLTDSFKRNGSEPSPTNDIFDKPNGKRRAPGEFDEDDDDDFGPETDVDAQDDLASPFAIAGVHQLEDELDEGVLNPFVEHQEKAAQEIERNMKQLREFEEEEEAERAAREEAPTPPADAVHDVSGLVENAAESESEDEWNYVKGEEASKEKEELQPEKKVAEIPEEDDSMSQLNPNAAEFVPVSPTRSIPSPSVCVRLMNDPVIAQSPKRPINIDINLPNPTEFEREVKSRPSDVDSYSNGHNNDEDRTTTPTDLMESILNGKNIDDIPEFQPGSTPKKGAPTDEFHFGPNAAPFTPIKPLDQSEAALSTRAIFGDESIATLGTSYNESTAQDLVSPDEVADPMALNKESDPMSMSFYAEKGDSNPFDLNKVQVLPDDLDAYLQQPDAEVLMDDTISDLPEHDPSTGLAMNNDDAIQTTDLDKQSYDDEKELASPLEPEKDFSDSEKDFSETENKLESQVQVHRAPSELENEEDLGIGGEEVDFAKTPEPTHENLLDNDFCHVVEKPELESLPPDVELITPEVEKPEVEALATDVESPAPVEPANNSTADLTPEEAILELETEAGKLALLDSTLDESKQESLAAETDSKSEIVLSPEPMPELEALSPELKQELNVSRPESKSETSETEELSSSEPQILPSAPQATEVDDLLGLTEATEVADLLNQLPVDNSGITPDSTSAEVIEEAQRHFDELCRPESATASVEDDRSAVEETSALINEVEDSFVADPKTLVCSSLQGSQANSPKEVDSVVGTDVELVTTTDLNSFLNRSLLPEPESPMSPDVDDTKSTLPTNDEPHQMSQEELAEYLSNPLNKCVYPLPPQNQNEEVHVETDVINREFAEQTVVTPSEESKQEEIPVTEEIVVPEVVLVAEEIPKAESVETAAVLGVVSAVAAGAAATAAVATAVEEEKKKPSSAKKPAGLKATASKTTTKSPAVARTGATKPVASPRTTPAKPGSTKPIAAVAPKAAAPKPTTTAPKPTTARPKTTITSKTTTTTTKTTEKKPLANGDAKPAVRSTLTAKKVTSETSSTLKSSARLIPTSSKPSPTKPSPMKSSTSAPRPSSRSVTTTSTGPTATKTASRPTTLSTRPQSATTLSKTATATTKPPVSKTTAAPSRASRAPTSTTANAVPSKAKTLSSRTAPKAADAEKQNKESANKITAARTTTTTRTVGVAGTKVGATTTRRVESKISTTRTTLSKTSSTTTTTKSTTAKKPLEIVKTKTTKIIEKQPKQNGTTATATVIEEIAAVVEQNGSESLLKDNSPVVDNKLMEAVEPAEA